MTTHPRRKTPERPPPDVGLFPPLPTQIPSWERDLLLAALARLLASAPTPSQEATDALSP